MGAVNLPMSLELHGLSCDAAGTLSSTLSRIVSAAALGCAGLLGAAPASAQVSAPVGQQETAGAAVPDVDDGSRWRDAWGDVGLPDYSIAVGSFAVILAFQFGSRPIGLARLEGGLLLDDPLRDALVLRSRADRDLAATISNYTWHSAEVYPALVDGLLVSLAIRQDPRLAWNVMVTSAAAISLTGALTSFFQRTVGRARPLYEPCLTDPDYAGMCSNKQRFQSFWSGHTAMAFTGAGLTCSNAAMLDLYDSEAGGVIACLGTLALATTTGYLRIAADRHWPSDVAVGALAGFTIGFGLPWLMHYQYGEGVPDRDDGPALQSMVTPIGGPDFVGLSWSGQFR